jgi:cytosine/adenosine deaminase-related metal-dependent hydrolase
MPTDISPTSIVARAATAAITVATLANSAIAQSSLPASSNSLLFRNVRVFDGTRVVAGQDVLVENGRIAKVGRGLGASARTEVIDGTGKTLLPGLIDSHTHVWPGSLQSAIAFGVTTELDMFSDIAPAKQARADNQRARQRRGRHVRQHARHRTQGHGTPSMNRQFRPSPRRARRRRLSRAHRRGSIT